MRNKRFTVPFADLNSSVGGSNNIVLEVPQTRTITSVVGNSEIRVMYPLEVQIINDCGTELEFLILNKDEWVDFQKDESVLFDFVRLPNGGTLTDDYAPMNRCYRLLLRAVSATATQDLKVEFINYKEVYDY